MKRLQELDLPDHRVTVLYRGVPARYARAGGLICAAARHGLLSAFGIRMRRHLTVRIDLHPALPVRLFTDGRSAVHLHLACREQLEPPGRSGLHHVYGLAHEVAHIAMYRWIPTTVGQLPRGAGEGWAHYAASIGLVPFLHRRLGPRAWPGGYDYLEIEGPRRFLRQLDRVADVRPHPALRAAKRLYQLGEQFGRRALGQALTETLRTEGASRALMRHVLARLKRG